MKVFVVLAVSIAMAASQNAYYPESAYKTPAGYPAQPYSFEWAVKDVESYNDYSHSETSDGKVTSGSYRVLLPDGRTQIVSYKDDSYGYVADVRYEGIAKYPEYKKPSAPVPVYKVPESAAPLYRTAPISPSYKEPSPVVYQQSPVVYRTTTETPVYNTPAFPPTVESYSVPESRPVYKEAPVYVVPSYKPPTRTTTTTTTTVAPPTVYEAPVTPFAYRARPSYPADPIPLLYRTTPTKQQSKY